MARGLVRVLGCDRDGPAGVGDASGRGARRWFGDTSGRVGGRARGEILRVVRAGICGSGVARIAGVVGLEGGARNPLIAFRVVLQYI